MLPSRKLLTDTWPYIYVHPSPLYQFIYSKTGGIHAWIQLAAPFWTTGSCICRQDVTQRFGKHPVWDRQQATSLETAIPAPLPWRGETSQQDKQQNNKIVMGKRTLWTFSPTWEQSLCPTAVSCVAINVPSAHADPQGCRAECSAKLELFNKSAVLGYPHSSTQTSPISN